MDDCSSSCACDVQCVLEKPPQRSHDPGATQLLTHTSTSEPLCSYES